jgi:hypothetical protein
VVGADRPPLRFSTSDAMRIGNVSSGTRCPVDRGNNPSCGFISPPLPSTSPPPLRSRHRPLTQRRSSPLFRDIFRDRLGHFRDTAMHPPNQSQVRPTTLTTVQHFQHLQKKSGRDVKVRGPRAEAHVPYATPPPGPPPPRRLELASSCAEGRRGGEQHNERYHSRSLPMHLV